MSDKEKIEKYINQVRHHLSSIEDHTKLYGSKGAQLTVDTLEGLKISQDYLDKTLNELGLNIEPLVIERYINGELVERMINKDKYLGTLLGLAVGDAVGTAVEFMPRGSFEPVTDMVGGGPFNLKAGEWTDDTSMALCLAESLIECNGFDARDQMDRYLSWYQDGHLSSNGKCFDIGNTTVSALRSYKLTDNPYSGSTDPMAAGNGSLMRLSPIPLYYSSDIEEAIGFASLSSTTTHGAIICDDACKYFSSLITGALIGIRKDLLLSDEYYIAPLCDEIREIAKGSYKNKTEDEISGSGYVVHTLEAALWSFYNSNSFEEGCLKVVNLGDDADTTGAVYGQIAGAYYGIDGIPKKWLDKLVKRELIEKFANDLFEISLEEWKSDV